MGALGVCHGLSEAVGTSITDATPCHPRLYIFDLAIAKVLAQINQSALKFQLLSWAIQNLLSIP